MKKHLLIKAITSYTVGLGIAVNFLNQFDFDSRGLHSICFNIDSLKDISATVPVLPEYERES